LATVSPSTEQSDESQSTGGKKRRRSTSHLKLVPETKEFRTRMRQECAAWAAKLDKAHPLAKDEMEQYVRQMLAANDWPEGYLGWCMVIMATEFWRDQVAAVPQSRRLFLMPHCLKHAEGCPADYDEFGLDCRKCGACSIADFRTKAEDQGYKVLVSEGTPIVLKIIVSGHVDAIVGVACLNVLEKAIDKILLAGIPCLAVPLLSSDCRNTSVDEDWVAEMIDTPHVVPEVKTSTYLHLMRGAGELFEPTMLQRLLPRVRGTTTLAEANGHGLAGLDPIASTEAISHDFLSRGGKHMRPFATLAVYDALTHGEATSERGPELIAEYPDHVRRVALAIETFHKASLVHDDIEDDDAYRYGQETLHKKFGVPVALNVGDYLVGVGYRLVSRDVAALGGEACTEILDRLADAQTRLCEGQGAELVWRDGGNQQITPIDALKIYALKTSPAFEVALFAGARLAGSTEQFQEPFSQFARNVGVAFQILNDLKDWMGDEDNKLTAGGDVFGGRPTVLWALALESLKGADREELVALQGGTDRSMRTLRRVRELYEQAGVFEKAHRLVDKYQQRAEQIADGLEPEALRRLFYYLSDTLLDRAGTTPAESPVAISQLQLPMTRR
jgi:geranylgeranyl pyrophosphate synthase